MSLNDRIKTARVNAGLSQSELARLTMTSQCSISHIETGDVDVSLLKARRIARACNVNPVWLMFGDAKQNSDEDSSNLLAINRSSIANRIKVARIGKGIKQKDLIKIVDCSRATLFLWEQGRHTPNTKTLAKLAQALDVSPGWLVFGIED